MTVTPLPDGTTGGPDATDDYKLLLKFVDDAEARVGKQGLYSQTGMDIDDAKNLVAAESASFEQILTGTTCDGLSNLQILATTHSGREQPDMMGLHRVVFSQARTAEEMATLGNDLLALPEVEYALLRSPQNIQVATPTPDFTPEQTYRPPDPGADFQYAHDLGLTGLGIRVTEIGISFDDDHEDLVDLIGIEPGFFDDGALIDFDDGFNDAVDHGTATLGMMASGNNGFGTTGMSYGADTWLYPSRIKDDNNNIFGRTEIAYCNALADSSASGPGEVVYLELETAFHAPLEFFMPIFDLTRMGTDAGVFVVEPAGNGDFNLDTASGDAAVEWRSWGDSGAIMVGAGSANDSHKRLSFSNWGSNYGSRVDVQGWGQNVVTTGGNGDRFNDGIHRKYTQSFGGTSSATPMVAAASVLLQEYASAQGLSRLDSADMRSLLTHTGIPQGTAVPGEIGPFIDVRAAIENADVADVTVETQQPSADIVTTIANQGPRIARNVSATITYSSGSTFGVTPVDIPESCTLEEPPDQCPGSCDVKYECAFDGITVEEPQQLVVDPGCQSPQIDIQVDSSVATTGELINPGTNSDQQVTSTVCLQ